MSKKIEPGKVKRILTYDAFSEAETATGESYKVNKKTESLGFMLHIQNVKERERVLKEMGDTSFTNTLNDYLLVAFGIGFKFDLVIPFLSESSHEMEKLFFLFHDKGILLVFDTFRQKVNGGKFYYCLSVKKENIMNLYNVTSSGSFVNYKEGSDYYIWKGSHDCREGLKYHIEEIEKVASFMNVWSSQPFLWFLHHGDTKDEKYDYEKINKERWNLLSDKVKKCIGELT